MSMYTNWFIWIEERNTTKSNFSTLLCDCLLYVVRWMLNGPNQIFMIFLRLDMAPSEFIGLFQSASVCLCMCTYCAAILMNFLKSCTRLQRVGHRSTSVITHCWVSLQRCNSCSSATVWPALASRLSVKCTSSCCTVVRKITWLWLLGFVEHCRKFLLNVSFESKL